MRGGLGGVCFSMTFGLGIGISSRAASAALSKTGVAAKSVIAAASLNATPVGRVNIIGTSRNRSSQAVYLTARRAFIKQESKQLAHCTGLAIIKQALNPDATLDRNPMEKQWLLDR
jgi:hypothetical protein